MLQIIVLIVALFAWAPAHALEKFLSGYDARALPNAQGALVRAAWSDIEIEPGIYDWSAINRQVAKIKADKKGWSLAILAGPFTPSFYATGPIVSYSLKGVPTTSPVFWDAAFQSGLASLLQASAKEFGADASLRVVYLPQATRNGVEGSLINSSADKTAWTAAGYTHEVFSAAVLSALDVALAAFPGTPVAVELHETDGITAQQQIINGVKLRANAALAVWWMGQGTYQTDLQTIITASGLPVYAQSIASYKNEPGRFDDYSGAAVGFSWIEQMSLDLGAVYLEYWPADLR